jgi:hypothetical protein
VRADVLTSRTSSNNNTAPILSRSKSDLSQRKPAENELRKQHGGQAAAVPSWSYPNTRRDESVVDKHGVADPYRWCVLQVSFPQTSWLTPLVVRWCVRVCVCVCRLENPYSVETRAWVEEQNEVTFSFLEECEYRGKIHERLKETFNYPKYSCPNKSGDRFYFFKNDGLQDQPVLYTQESLEAEPTVPTFSLDLRY